MAWIIRVGGKTRAYHIAYIVTFWYILFYPSIRRRCQFYLKRRFPRETVGSNAFGTRIAWSVHTPLRWRTS